MNKIGIIFLFFLSCCSVVSHAISKIAEEKLSANTMFVDTCNTIWIGTDNGLFQWKNTASVRVPLSITLEISAIDRIGDFLILGTKQGQVYAFCTCQKILTLMGNMNAEISSIQKIKNSLYITSKGKGLFIMTPFNMQLIDTKNGLTDNFLYALSAEKNTIWVSTDAGIHIISPDNKVRPWGLNSKITDRLVTCFAIRDSFVYCGTQLGDVCKINLRDSSVVLFDNTIWHQAQINDVKILDAAIAIATEKGAFILGVDGHLIETVADKRSVKKIAIDREANIWFCGNQLIANSLGEQLSLIRYIGTNKITDVHALCIDKSNNLYFTPDQGLVKYNEANKVYQQNALTPAAQLIDITSLFVDAFGTLWAGTTGKGLYKIDTATLAWKHISIDSSVETSGILSITGDTEKIWISSLNGVWYSYINKGNYSFKSLEDEYGKKKYFVYQVKKDSKNNVWLATDGQGVLKLSKNLLSTFIPSKTSDANVFYSVDEDADGAIWFNALNDGVYCQRKDSLIHLTQHNGLLSNDILCMAYYCNQYMLAASEHGIDLIDTKNFAVTSFNFESLRMAQTPESNSITSDHLSTAYIGTNIGMLKMYVPSYKTRFTPQAVIENILVMDKNCLKEKNDFGSEENYFRFKIAANLNTDQAIYYRYKLKGLSEQWNHTIDKEVVFPRLNPGKYTFVLQTANNRSFLNSTQDSYAFVIRNPFWKQWWFILLSLLVFSVGAYYYIRFREQRISRVQQLEKEKAIAEFETLKHQVSPHFLFNSFNTLIQVIDEDKDQAIEYTQMLSDFYRSLISYRHVDLVTLEEELTLLDKYIYLQQMRFGDSFQLRTNCDPLQIKQIQIPPLTLQLLAENAIKHNTVSSMKPLLIEIELSDKAIVVSNNINQKISKEAGENIGLLNIKNRFKLFSKQEVVIHKTDERFEIRIPILKL